MIRDSAAAFACLGDVSINEVANFKSELSIYPNPANNNITLSGGIITQGGTKNIVVIGHTGSVVITKTVTLNGEEGININIESLAKGIYLLSISQEGLRSSIHLIKN